MVDFDDYARGRRPRERGTGPAIAVIEAEGPIVTGRDGGGNPFSGGSTIYSDTVSDAFYDAIRAKDVKAIVFRLNSPGGSDTGVRADPGGRARGQGGQEAGGGLHGDLRRLRRLLGGLGGLGHRRPSPPRLQAPSACSAASSRSAPALARFGVDVRQLGVGNPNAGAYGIGQEFTPEQHAVLSKWMDTIYENFVQRWRPAATCRSSGCARSPAATSGPGVQAKQLGLVDELGGFYQAVDKAKALAGVTGDARLKRMTPNSSTFEALEKMLGRVGELGPHPGRGGLAVRRPASSGADGRDGPGAAAQPGRHGAGADPDPGDPAAAG